MQEKEKLILIESTDGTRLEDRTSSIKSVTYRNESTIVVFNENATNYPFRRERVKVFSLARKLDITDMVIYFRGLPLTGYSEMYDFGRYVKLFTPQGYTRLFLRKDIEIDDRRLVSERQVQVFSYLSGLADAIPVLEQEDDNINVEPNAKALIAKAFDQISADNTLSVLSFYLRGEQLKSEDNDTIVYPFGCNESQKIAVKSVLNNNINVVEGPPGTGKTQTILNIIANILMRNKTVAIVSNNNSAVSNVQEKLQKEGYGFFTAFLGNNDNKKAFFAADHEFTLSKNWDILAGELHKHTKIVKSLSSKIEQYLCDKNRVAQLKRDLSVIELEYLHLKKENSLSDELSSQIKKIFPKGWDSRQIIAFKVYVETLELKNKVADILNCLNLIFGYHIFNFWKFYKYYNNISLILDEWYYCVRIQEVRDELINMEKYLYDIDFESLLANYVNSSKMLFNNYLYKKHVDLEPRVFSKDDYKRNFQDFITHFPVILSTTHSIVSSIKKDFLFDYLIIDESSQVDILTAALAFSCCKNVVIIGDSMQLSHIKVKEVDQVATKEMIAKQIPLAYSYGHNILTSLVALYGDQLSKTLLKEHYRCHPKIIEYCNQKFYNNELVIMTSEKQEDTPFRVYTTVPGNHCCRIKLGNKNVLFNQRQLDVIKNEIINNIEEKNYKGIGIISPYRYQADEMGKQMPESMEVDTIHKFQGREKELIIFTTVNNKLDNFMDKANLINVAVSRAKSQFIIIKANDIVLPHGSNLGDLIRYISYISLGKSGSFIESHVVSVFDILYKQYSQELLNFRRVHKRRSAYDSENIMYEMIHELLKEDADLHCFDFVMHYRLNELVVSGDDLTEREKAFLQNNNSHLDFLIYNKLDKSPVLAVEVDGFKYHQQNSKQKERDVTKDSILEKRGIQILRFSTDGSNEIETLSQVLQNFMKV